MVIFRLLSSVGQIWSWVGMGYFWHAQNTWAVVALGILALAISFITAFVEVIDEKH